MDWQFTNVTSGGTHLLVTAATEGVNQTYPYNPLTFELRVSNWGYGIQIDQVHVAAGQTLASVPNYGRAVEFIGDSLSSGMYTSYEGLSGFAVCDITSHILTPLSISYSPGHISGEEGGPTWEAFLDFNIKLII